MAAATDKSHAGCIDAEVQRPVGGEKLNREGASVFVRVGHKSPVLEEVKAAVWAGGATALRGLTISALLAEPELWRGVRAGRGAALFDLGKMFLSSSVSAAFVAGMVGHRAFVAAKEANERAVNAPDLRSHTERLRGERQLACRQR